MQFYPQVKMSYHLYKTTVWRCLGQSPIEGYWESIYSWFSVVEPAGSTTALKGEHALQSDEVEEVRLEIIIQSRRDERTLEWLVAQVGREAVDQACARLGGRRAYVSNIAKTLGVSLPESLQRPSKEEAMEYIRRIRKRLAEPPAK